jgi:hypothetical protein
MIKTSASEFRAVVQSLTGRKRSSAFGIQYKETNSYTDNQYSPPLKVTKLEDGLQNLNDTITSESALIDDNATVNNSCSDKGRGDLRILEDLEVLPIQIPHHMLSQRLVFDAMETIGDLRHIVFGPSSPSIIFSGFE